ncbi:poly rna polymerase cid14 [Lichtheimia corymbifera JMRC:FSU:9682]|uniref:polynucleotide adenylyltransferase n=1 Tax=Lichtheimia corymbifera JMRC:FSU:9682 TaxID=1263082 RepID=A0A068RM95_9FUNG|nr:poly rna polymerase cid14 [Lichtheimia corymbifera JMRC:FSU:9682]
MGRKSRKKQKTRAQRNSADSPGWESATDRNDLMSGGEGSNSNRDSRQSSPGAVDRTDDQAIANGDDFISLSVGDDEDNKKNDSRQAKRRRERERVKENRKRKRAYDSDSEDDDGISAFPWLEWMPDTVPGPLNVDKLFDQEVQSIVRYLEPTKGEKTLRDFLVYRIKETIESAFPGSEVEVFGSFATDMYLPNSDIDMVVQGSGVNLKLIARRLERAGIADNMQMILHAQVPVIKFEDSLTRIKVDIITDSDSGVSAAECITSMMRKQPGLRPLTLLIKHYLMLKGLNEVFSGGMGGYAIVCMVMSFLQMHPKISTGQIDPLKNLSTLLIEFFQLYGLLFNLEDVGICVKGKGQYFEKRNILSRQGRPLFTIRDPMNLNNDLGMKSYNAYSVVRQFRFAYSSMTFKIFDLEENSHNHHRYYPRKDVSLSILSKAFCIPTSMVELRAQIDKLFKSRTWEQDPDAKPFLESLQE